MVRPHIFALDWIHRNSSYITRHGQGYMMPYGWPSSLEASPQRSAGLAQYLFFFSLLSLISRAPAEADDVATSLLAVC